MSMPTPEPNYKCGFYLRLLIHPYLLWFSKTQVGLWKIFIISLVFQKEGLIIFCSGGTDTHLCISGGRAWSMTDWHVVQKIGPFLPRGGQFRHAIFFQNLPCGQIETNLHLRLHPCYLSPLLYPASLTFFLLKGVTNKLYE